jgi:hypothetical protein
LRRVSVKTAQGLISIDTLRAEIRAEMATA